MEAAFQELSYIDEDYALTKGMVGWCFGGYLELGRTPRAGVGRRLARLS